MVRGAVLARNNIDYSIVPDLFTGLSVALTVYGMWIDAGLGLALRILVLTSFLDSIDGKAARKLGGTKRNPTRGKLMDTVADLINFGIFPSYLIYRSGQQFAWLWVFYISCMLYRLIRFYNSALPSNATTYQGVPSPFAAIIAVAFLKLGYLAFGVVLISLLMISKAPTIVLHRLSPKDPLLFYIVSTSSVVLAFIWHEVLFGILLSYLIHIPFARWIEKNWVKPMSKVNIGRE
jgi:CDP-diacylglycerol---serine O-phosphatidyltransferase